MQNKKPLQIILHVGRVPSLQSWMAKKSCHGQTLTNECSISDYPSNFEGSKVEEMYFNLVKLPHVPALQKYSN